MKILNTKEYIIDGIKYFICEECGYKHVLQDVFKEAQCYDHDIASATILFHWFCVCGKKYYFTRPSKQELGKE